MNILFSIEHLEFGGAQTIVLSLSSAIAEKTAHKVYLINQFPEKVNRSMIDTLLSPKVKVISINTNKPVDFITWKLNAMLVFLGFSHSFRAKVKTWYFEYCLYKYKIDIVTSHLMGSDYVCSQVLKNKQIPLVINEHGEYSTISITDADKIDLVKKIISQIDAIVTVSEFCRQAISVFTQSFTGIIQTIYNGITLQKVSFNLDPRKQLNIPDNAFVFGLVGRGIKEKGWSEAIEAFSKAISLGNFTEIHMILVGEGEYLEGLRKNPALSNDRIHYVGFSNNPGYWIQAFDIGMLPSYAEALGNVIIEYMFYGKPVIATRVGGIPETIGSYTNTQAGFLVDMIDGRPDVNQLADYMFAYIKNPDLLNIHAANTKKAIEKFSMDKCVDNYINLFTKLTTYKKNSR